MTGADGLLNGHAYFIHWGVVQIALANLIVIALMIVIFVLALVLPFPHGHDQDDTLEDRDVRK
jgi:hypothetical protein